MVQKQVYSFFNKCLTKSKKTLWSVRYNLVDANAYVVSLPVSKIRLIIDKASACGNSSILCEHLFATCQELDRKIYTTVTSVHLV